MLSKEAIVELVIGVHPVIRASNWRSLRLVPTLFCSDESASTGFDNSLRDATVTHLVPAIVDVCTAAKTVWVRVHGKGKDGNEEGVEELHDDEGS